MYASFPNSTDLSNYLRNYNRLTFKYLNDDLVRERVANIFAEKVFTQSSELKSSVYTCIETLPKDKKYPLQEVVKEVFIPLSQFNKSKNYDKEMPPFEWGTIQKRNNINQFLYEADWYEDTASKIGKERLSKFIYEISDFLSHTPIQNRNHLICFISIICTNLSRSNSNLSRPASNLSRPSSRKISSEVINKIQTNLTDDLIYLYEEDGDSDSDSDSDFDIDAWEKLKESMKEIFMGKPVTTY